MPTLFLDKIHLFGCVKFSIVVEESRFKVSFICLPLKELDVTLRIDRIFVNSILIPYGQ